MKTSVDVAGKQVSARRVEVCAVQVRSRADCRPWSFSRGGRRHRPRHVETQASSLIRVWRKLSVGVIFLSFFVKAPASVGPVGMSEGTEQGPERLVL